MKKHLLFIMLFLGMVTINAQTVFDYETPETTIIFQFFGGAQDGVILDPVDNPNPTGINTSATVYPFIEIPTGLDWAGGFSQPNPIGGIDATNGGQVCLDVHFAEANSLTMKLETGVEGDPTWEQTIQNDIIGEWTTLCYDLTIAGEGNGSNAVGQVFAKLVLFHGLGEAAPEEQVIYLDNIKFPEGGDMEEMSTIILDAETAETSTGLFHFSSTLDGTVLPPVANPNMSGINESATVFELIKPTGAQPWAGAYTDPNPTTPVNTTSGKICVDVHMDHIGTISIKLEESANGGANWIQTVPNTVVNEWETLCIDFSALSIEDPAAPATGDVYSKIVFFADFQMPATDVDVTTYLDNIVVVPDNTPPVDAEVTFSLDMNSYTESFTTPYVSGTFNSWSGESNPLSDEDGDGVWTTTLPIPNGTYEYLFTLDNWVAKEEFSRTSACTTTFDNGDGQVNTNRLVAISGDVMLPTNCFSSCYACGEEVNITFNLAVTEPSESGVWLAGGEDFGAPGGNFQMSDEDGDGVYSISVARNIGYQGYYTFTNGISYDFKENIEGQDCARPENFNDRFLDAVTTETTITTCFGECTVDTNCTPPADPTMTTFSVDMNEVSEVSAEGVYIIGEFSNWGDIAMEDEDADGVWTVTIAIDRIMHEYKFKNGLAGENQESLEAGTSCTITTTDGQFTNRVIDLTEAEDTSAADLVCYESCAACMTNTDDLEANNNLINLYPTITQDLMYLDVLTSFDNGTVQIISLQGELMNTILIGNNTVGNAINVANYPQGTYMLSLTTDSFRSTKRFVKM